MSLPSLDELRFAGLLRPIDLHFAKGICELAGENSSEASLAAAMVSARLGDGHPCLDLRDLAQQAVQLGDGSTRHFPGLSAWRGQLAGSILVSDGSRNTPLVLSEDRLYLRRYWLHEQFVANSILDRAKAVVSNAEPGSMQVSLDRLFGNGRLADDQQRMAALMAARRQFSVVSGGPGTGKTFTVVKILALLIEQAFSESKDPPRMLLTAPTGKAAARLVESIVRAKSALPCEQAVKDAIPEEASTIHRALGASGSGTRFRYNQDNLLVIDLVLVDEASMVNVALMSRLMAALPKSARVILLGDRDQLASVEAGSVLADICNAGMPSSRSVELARDVEELTSERLTLSAQAPRTTGIWDCVTHLAKSYRYAQGSGIEALAMAIHAGDLQGALRVLRDPAYPDVTLEDPEPRRGLSQALLSQSMRGYAALLAASEPRQALAALDQFRILCAHHQGAASVAHINAELRDKLNARSRAGRRDSRDAESYHLRPIIVNVNDYELRLFNGDLGVTMQDSDGLWTYFESEDLSVRKLRSSRLPAHQLVYAMSVHKSQGSEFNDVAIVLPRDLSPVLSRELIYTAVTRAKKSLTLYAGESALAHCIARPTQRASGLRTLLWGPLSEASSVPALAKTPAIETAPSNAEVVVAETAPARVTPVEVTPVVELQPTEATERIPLLVPAKAASTKDHTERRQGRQSEAGPAAAQQELGLDLGKVRAEPKPVKPRRQRQPQRRAAAPVEATSCCSHKSAALLRCPRCAHIWVECCTC